MKRFVIVLVVFVFFGLVGRFETVYTEEAKVISIDKEADEVLFQTEDGNVFAIYYEDGFTIGEVVKLVMDNNFTEETKEDDVILKVR